MRYLPLPWCQLLLLKKPSNLPSEDKLEIHIFNVEPLAGDIQSRAGLGCGRGLLVSCFLLPEAGNDFNFFLDLRWGL